jgi:hypothetical protein
MHCNAKTAFAVRSVSFVVAAAGALIGSHHAALAQSAASPPEAAVSSIVAQHAIAQQGLSLGLAAALAQGQIAVMEAPVQIKKCHRIGGGGSIKTLQGVRKGRDSRLTVEVYYDNTCHDRYINARVVAHKLSASLLTARVVATNYGLNGHPLGKLALSERIVVGTGKFDMSAGGTFTPAGSSAVDVGINCDILDLRVVGPTGKDVCRVGIAQNLPAAGGDLASVTPITVAVRRSTPKSTFVANNAQMAKGRARALGISVPNGHSPTITGTKKPIGTASGHGTYAVFSMFQKGPTSWVSTDRKNNVRFAISLSRGAKTLHGTIKALGSSAKLATLSVDISGTGSITYSNHKTAAIKSWVLTN